MRRFIPPLLAALVLSNGCTAVYFRTQILDAIGPTTAVAVAPDRIVAASGQTVVMSGSDSSLVLGSGSVLGPVEAGFTFAWSLVAAPGGAVAPTLANITSSQAGFTATTAGRYTVRLTVTDGTHSDTADVTIDVL